MAWVINPHGRKVSVPESSQAYRDAIGRVNGWSLAPDTSTDKGEASASPASDLNVYTEGPPPAIHKRGRGRPRKRTE